MNPLRLALLLAVFPGTVAPALSAQSAYDGAASFPSKPVRWVVGFTPGASNDVIARTIGARLTEAWGQHPSKRRSAAIACA